jgi:hypothetical protein
VRSHYVPRLFYTESIGDENDGSYEWHPPLGLDGAQLDGNAQLFVDVLGFQQVGEVPNYPAIFVSDGSIVLTLWQAIDPEKATPFDRKNNIGLHHFALKVADLEVLHDLHQTLQNTSIDFTHGRILHLAGRAEVIWEGAEISTYPGAERLLRFNLERGDRVEGSLPLCWSAPEFSPFLQPMGAWES